MKLKDFFAQYIASSETRQGHQLSHSVIGLLMFIGAKVLYLAISIMRQGRHSGICRWHCLDIYCLFIGATSSKKELLKQPWIKGRRFSGVDLKLFRDCHQCLDYYCAKVGYADSYPGLRTAANKYMTVRPFATGRKRRRCHTKSLTRCITPNNLTVSSVWSEKIAAVDAIATQRHILHGATIWSRAARR